MYHFCGCFFCGSGLPKWTTKLTPKGDPTGNTHKYYLWSNVPKGGGGGSGFSRCSKENRFLWKRGDREFWTRIPKIYIYIFGRGGGNPKIPDFWNLEFQNIEGEGVADFWNVAPKVVM